MSNIGKILKGFCNGYFGRDSYGDKIVEAEGHDWIVAREEGLIVLATFTDETEKNEFIEKWVNGDNW